MDTPEIAEKLKQYGALIEAEDRAVENLANNPCYGSALDLQRIRQQRIELWGLIRTKPLHVIMGGKR